MIKRIINFLIETIKIVLVIVVAIPLTLFIFVILTGPPISAWYQAIKQGKCIKDPSSETSTVNFAERVFNLPTKHILSCYPIDMSSYFDYDPANVSLNAQLPGFEPIDNSEKTHGDYQDNEIRIRFTGSRKNSPITTEYEETDLNKYFAKQPTYTDKKTGEKLYKGPIQTPWG